MVANLNDRELLARLLQAERTSRAELKMKKSPGDELMFAEGGPVKAQVSGKGFKGTF